MKSYVVVARAEQDVAGRHVELLAERRELGRAAASSRVAPAGSGSLGHPSQVSDGSLRRGRARRTRAGIVVSGSTSARALTRRPGLAPRRPWVTETTPGRTRSSTTTVARRARRARCVTVASSPSVEAGRGGVVGVEPHARRRRRRPVPDRVAPAPSPAGATRTSRRRLAVGGAAARAARGGAMCQRPSGSIDSCTQPYSTGSVEARGGRPRTRSSASSGERASSAAEVELVGERVGIGAAEQVDAHPPGQLGEHPPDRAALGHRRRRPGAVDCTAERTESGARTIEMSARSSWPVAGSTWVASSVSSPSITSTTASTSSRSQRGAHPVGFGEAPRSGCPR